MEKEVKDVKLQIRRAAEFLQNSFPGGAEVVLFGSKFGTKSSVTGLLIKKAWMPNNKRPLWKGEKMNYKMILQYDGTRYNGWQKRGNTDNTIQGKLETLLSRIAGESGGDSRRGQNRCRRPCGRTGRKCKVPYRSIR